MRQINPISQTIKEDLLDFEAFYKKYDDSLKRIKKKQSGRDFDILNQIPSQNQFASIKTPQFSSRNYMS